MNDFLLLPQAALLPFLSSKRIQLHYSNESRPVLASRDLPTRPGAPPGKRDFQAIKSQSFTTRSSRLIFGKGGLLSRGFARNFWKKCHRLPMEKRPDCGVGRIGGRGFQHGMEQTREGTSRNWTVLRPVGILITACVCCKWWQVWSKYRCPYIH